MNHPSIALDKGRTQSLARDLQQLIARCGGKATYTQALDFIAAKAGFNNTAGLSARLNKLGPIPTPPAHFATGDIPLLPNSLVYLTNVCCEVTCTMNPLTEGYRAHFGLAEFRALGLSYSLLDGEFHPLTAEESLFIAEDIISFDDGMSFHLPYSALYLGQKWLLPTGAICFDTSTVAPEDRNGRTDQDALKIARQFVAAAQPVMASIGGYAFLNPYAEDDRHEVMLLIPFEYAQSKARCFDAWKTELHQTIEAIRNSMDDGKRLRPRIRENRIVVTVFSEDDEHYNQKDLEQIAYDITNGDYIGWVYPASSRLLAPEEVRPALGAIHNDDLAFFDINPDVMADKEAAQQVIADFDDLLKKTTFSPSNPPVILTRYNDAPRTVFIDWISVPPEFRRKGLGSWLMRALCSLADNAGVPLRTGFCHNPPGDRGGLSGPDLLGWFNSFGFEGPGGNQLRQPNQHPGNNAVPEFPTTLPWADKTSR